MSRGSEAPLRGDLDVPVAVDTLAMAWTQSPSPAVRRKRLHRVGPAESGQVTSVVEYAPGSSFPLHEHPDGEEFFVLSGVFSDEHGDWRAGTFVVNPDGSSHAPFSREGCVLFVKLRQAPGAHRSHVAVHSDDICWKISPFPGVEQKTLYAPDAFPERVRLERWNRDVGPREHAGGVEIYVLEGRFSDDLGAHGPGAWLRLPPATTHRPRVHSTVLALVKSDGFAVLVGAIRAPPTPGGSDIDSSGVYEGLSAADLGYGDLPRVRD